MNRRPSRKSVPHACDACRRRKIKCDGLNPCPSCLSANLSCTFNVPQKKGGNRGVRATVLNEIRAGQAEDYQDILSTEQGRGDGHESLTPYPSTTFTVLGVDGLEGLTVDSCIDAYTIYVYPVVPLLSPQIIWNEAALVTTSLLSRQFISSFCAYVVTFGNIISSLLPATSQGSESELSKKLLNAATPTLNQERLTRPSATSAYISFFLYGAHTGLGDYRQGWFYLREATTLFLLLRDVDRQGWFDERAYRCLFWVLLVSERHASHAIRRNRPTTLQITPSTPGLSLHEPSELVLHYLSSLFRPFDDAFLALWNGARQDCTKEWLIELENDVRTALPPVLDLAGEQVANLRVSQLWLQIKLWELFPRYGFLSMESVHRCLTFAYPVDVARDLCVLLDSVGVGDLQVHGIGMTEKIFDIACALADVLPFISTSSSGSPVPVAYLRQNTALLSKLPGGSSKFVPLLLAKINELVPELVQTLCDASEISDFAISFPMSPNTRFIYEEEVGRALYADLRRRN
ncbi:hypothetical protein P280DRAFT_391533 [Massarina eburnea CBS 473.64]|uniref:Zn(2)-C6 fungal-type domain-containing protein n=1 Tax=Massarina eburnea CBS 473.64 TaxID=1395130 RepID=A0A6A6SEM7_9PLEO|nr:hypothetical protein P280DRAFT_391533 [Massarina eburnea CBS 473.64]